ncbi:hypothetical protein BOX15_Mlig005315g3 [Macrostomum lignano]|uniref:Uncharacterized protein n=3 Tax=Macrostomum lignano TaxID=282301 RepID=A0A267DW67_9PLAT|nr:hypothetical protein BOX15_Mlig005315g3 [Macrostomum lignano]
MNQVLHHLSGCHIQLVRESSGLNPAAEDAEDSGNLIVQLGANRHSVAQRIEANLNKRGSAAAQALLDDVQTATESERNLYAMLTPAELLSCGSSNSAAGPADVVSDFGLPVSLMRCLLEVPPLQAGLAEMLAELLVAIDKSDYPVCLQVNYTKLILSQFRYLPLAREAASRIEAILFDIIEASSLDAKRDTIALLPELFTQATDSLCEKLRSLLVSATELDDTSGSHGNASSTPLKPALFDCLTLLPLSESQLGEFRRLAMQLLASVRSCLSIPVLLRFLLDNPPSEPDAVIEFLMEIRSRLDMFAVPVLEQQKQQTQVQQVQIKQQPKWLTSTQQPGDTGGSWASLNISGIQPMAPNAASSAANLAASAAATETAETLVCELVQRKLAANPQLADCWLRAIEAFPTSTTTAATTTAVTEQQQQRQSSVDSLHLVDLLVLAAAFSAARRSGGGGSSRNSRRRRQAVLRLCRSLIRNRRLPARCGADLRCHHPVLARRMAEQLVDLLDGLAANSAAADSSSLAAGQSWARAVSSDMFGCLSPHWQQSLVACLLSRLGSEPDHALQCLVDVADAWPTELASFAALLRAALDVLHQLGPGQARLLYSALARLAYRGCGGGRQALQDDLCILVRKQLWHSRPMYQSYGVLGVLAMLQCITPSEELQQRHLLLSQQLGSQQVAACESTEDVKSAVSLVNLVRKACTQAPHVSLLFLDELASLLEAGKLNAKLAAWLAEVAKKDFFDNYTSPSSVGVDEAAASDTTRQPRLGLAQSAAQMAVAIDSVPARRLPCLPAHLRLLAACVPARGIAGLALCPLIMPHPQLCSPPVLLAAANWCTQVANSFASSPEFESAVVDRLRRSVELRAEFELSICRPNSSAAAAAAADAANSSEAGVSGGGIRSTRWEQPLPLAQLDGTAVTHVTLRWQNTQQPSKPKKSNSRPAKKRRRGRRATDDGDDDDEEEQLEDNDSVGLGFGHFDANDSVAAAAAAVVSSVVEDLATVAKDGQNQMKRQSGAGVAVNKLVSAEQLGPCYRLLTDSVFLLMAKWTDEQMGEPLILHLLEDLHRRAVGLLGSHSGNRGRFGRSCSSAPADPDAVNEFLATVSQLSARLVGLLLKAADPSSSRTPAPLNNRNNESRNSDAISEDEADHPASKSVLDSSCSGRIVQLIVSILSLTVSRMSNDKSGLLLATLMPLAKPDLAPDADLATVAKQAAACVGRLIPSACPTLETALDALTLCRCILGAPNDDMLVWSGEVLVRRWDIKKRDQLARVYRLLVEAASPAKRPALIGRLLANHIQPVAAGVSTSIESADDPDAVCPSLTRPGVPDAFAQLLGDLARHCQSNCGILLPQASSNNSVASDESDQQLLMRGWPDSLAALHVGLDVVRAWPECVRLQAIALRHGRALVESFMRHGLPLLGRQFRCRSEPAVRLLKQIQLSTRQLQAVANTCKDRNDGPTSALVPPLRRTLETFIYRVRALVARHDCAAAFEPGQLKLKNIQGEEMDEIRRPEDYDVSSTSDEDEAAGEDGDEEAAYGDSDAAADDCGDDDGEEEA